jgi:hypothetical protein
MACSTSYPGDPSPEMTVLTPEWSTPGRRCSRRRVGVPPPTSLLRRALRRGRRSSPARCWRDLATRLQTFGQHMTVPQNRPCGLLQSVPSLRTVTCLRIAVRDAGTRNRELDQVARHLGREVPQSHR